MLKRLIVGLILGTVIGAVVAAVLVQGLGIAFFNNAAFAYLAAGVTGLLTGLIAGKPIWSADGRIEAGLKAFFGALLGVGGMFALRQWVHVSLDLASLKAGVGQVGDLPAASLPMIAAVLGGFFELDNTPGSDDEKKADSAKGAATKGALAKKVRVADEDEDADEELEEPAPQAKKKGR